MRTVFLVSTILLLQTSFATTKTYDTQFNGLIMGESTLADAVDWYGAPRAKTALDENVLYEYGPFTLSIQDKTGRISSVQVFDQSYIDLNGISVGYSKESVSDLLNQPIGDDWVADDEQGLIYWFQDGRVSKIVIVHELKK